MESPPPGPSSDESTGPSAKVRPARRPEALLARRGGAVELLRLPAFLFGKLAGLRGKLYDRGVLRTRKLEAPVVCVGNLSVGGTGKTPMVLYLLKELSDRGRNPGVLSRGYRSPEAGAKNDEGLLFEVLSPGLAQVQNPDRVAGGRELIKRGVDVVVMDDGFQHRRLYRDLDLVLVDATRPWGLPAVDSKAAVRAVLPRGLLRELPSALNRADAIVLTRADQVDDEMRAKLEGELHGFAPGRPIFWAVHRPAGLRSLLGGEEALVDLEGRRVSLVSGIGNPDAFEDTVRSLGAEVSEHLRFGDHHAFGPGDLAPLADLDQWIVTTAKDAVKLLDVLSPELLGRVRVLSIEMALTKGEQVLEALLDALPRSRAEQERRSIHGGLHG
ncbi:MAG: tetraacyldisaccharide 4'-kinase [Planctomycetota bacterium]